LIDSHSPPSGRLLRSFTITLILLPNFGGQGKGIHILLCQVWITEVLGIVAVPRNSIRLELLCHLFSLQNHHTATNESATKALTTTLVPIRTPPKYQIHSTFFAK
jgi:hypothetical protein